MKYEFGKFVLDPIERVLFSNGEPTHLADKVFDTLLLFVRHNGKLLTKDEMMTSIWEESFVEEGNLAKNISRLRKILNTDGVELIETLPRRGYRFRADVRQIEGETNLLVHRRLKVTMSQSDGRVPATNGEVDRHTADEIRSIAVLPFQPLGGRADDDFFGLGVTDALITQLSRAGQIQVRPTSSILKFNIQEQDAVLAGRALEVDAILQGNFQRSERKLRLTVQMIRSRNGNAIWADSFGVEFEDIFDVQDRIAARVLGALTKELGDDAEPLFSKRDTENVAAYQEYLKGRYFYNKRTTIGYEVALASFEKAIEIDPSYARAYAGLADIYNLLPVYDGFAPRDYFPKAKAAALKALFIDPDLAEAHAALGLALLHYDWNWAGAEVSFQNAVKLDPNYAPGYQLLGVYFLRVERIGESLIALKKARELDPFSPINAVWLAEVLRHFGETEASIRLHAETIESFPEFFLAHYHLAFAYVDAGRLDEAEFHRERAVALSNENSLTLSLQGILQQAAGNTGAVRETLAKLVRVKEEKYISSVNIASVYAAMRDESNALEWLETGLKERDPNLTWIKFDKEFKFLQPHPRFQALLREVGLAEKNIEAAQRPTIETKRWAVVFAIAALAVAAVSTLSYFWNRAVPALPNEAAVIHLTADKRNEYSPHWTKDGQIRFLRTGSDKETESLVMNADGSNQTVARDFPGLDHGFWSPDGTKVVFTKPNSKTDFYLADADGSNEIPLEFFGGNFDWSPDSRKIAYQKKVSTEDDEIFVYSLETRKSENVTNSPSFDADPNFSPDGRQIAFASLRDGNAEIYLMNVDGSDVRRLTNHPSWDSHPVFSPDGTAIAFPSDRESEDSDVYVMRSDGQGAVRRLTFWKSNESVGPGSWSPDGTKILFVSDRDGNDDIFMISAEVDPSQLVVMDVSGDLQFPSYSPDGRQIVYQSTFADKSGELRVFDVDAGQSRLLLKAESANFAPVFSPDGTQIAFQNRIENNTEICLIKTDGSDLRNLTNNPARDGTPDWSPDGTQIVFSSNRGGNYGKYDLFLMSANGGDQREIYSNKNGMSLSPAWSADGVSIVFANDKEDGARGNFEIFKITVGSGEAAQRLTFRPRYDGSPALSPDGKKIAFTSNNDGNDEIYAMNSDGTGLTRITRNSAEDSTPRFSPDGRRIIFSSNRSGKFALYEIAFSD
ncbi:MAG TPA: winged helix-turn-helix domain-containing protein [Pyrinomonadaceae bacterium]|nr:winged helix-turn-helix domain-containing protein [Pyrinomonadaceae bacterium]